MSQLDVYFGGSFQETRLSQLERLVRLNKEHRDDLNERGQWLLDGAMFTIYCDLEGPEEKARAQKILTDVPEELTRNPG